MAYDSELDSSFSSREPFSEQAKAAPGTFGLGAHLLGGHPDTDGVGRDASAANLPLLLPSPRKA